MTGSPVNPEPGDPGGRVRGVITVDGPAGSGKSTISRLLAERLGFVYLDTGAMYRAVALAAGRKGIPLDDGERLEALCKEIDLSIDIIGGRPRFFLDGEDVSRAIRTPEMDMAASRVSAVPEVRKAMTRLQRRIAAGMNVVAEGRDMGTVVFPRAARKFFLTASPEVRADRRYRERLARGERVTRESVAAELEARDRQDRTRSVAPLRPAGDAVIIDSSRLSPEGVVAEILRHLDVRS